MARIIEEYEPWWRSDTFIRELTSDGQTFTRAYSNCHDGAWEYALVTFTDDGCELQVVVFTDGKALIVEP